MVRRSGATARRVFFALGAPALTLACDSAERSLLPPTPAPGGSAGASGIMAAPPCGGAVTLEDRDGDGASAYYTVDGCLQIIDPTSLDCDDTDPTRQVLVYPDSDGDGAGSNENAECVATDDIPDGYATSSGDCDDGDPGTGPFALDIPGDGLDQDCQGGDAQSCANSDTLCPCESPPDAELSDPGSCTGFDLAVLNTTTCRLGCAPSFFLRIVNLGTADFSGVLMLAQGSVTLTFRGDLAAGETTDPLDLGYRLSTESPITLSAVGGGDCNPDNDTFPGTGQSLPTPLCK